MEQPVSNTAAESPMLAAVSSAPVTSTMVTVVPEWWRGEGGALSGGVGQPSRTMRRDMAREPRRLKAETRARLTLSAGCAHQAVSCPSCAGKGEAAPQSAPVSAPVFLSGAEGGTAAVPQ